MTTLHSVTYNPETGHLTRNGRRAGTLMKIGYREVRVNGKRWLEHRLIMWLMDFDLPPGAEVDHINGIRDDNRWANLRIVSRAGNALNRKDAKGVAFHKNRRGTKLWSARIQGKNGRHLGYFATEAEARAAYLAAKATEEYSPFADI